jgi:hypothetical protein
MSIQKIQKTKQQRRRGRPPGREQDKPFQMRVSERFLRLVDDWRRRQSDLPSRAEAIRRLVEMAMREDASGEVDRQTK